jgi:hypothetical protein
LPCIAVNPRDDPSHALFYLKRATEGWRDPRVLIEPAATAMHGSWPVAPFHIVNDPLGTPATEELRKRIEAGAFALVLVRDESMIATAAALAGETGWSAAPPDGRRRADAMLGEIDFRHPLFAPFADPRFSDFTRARFWRPVRMTLPETSAAQIAARFDDGSPAVIECEIGSGRLVVWAGDWTPAASQWVLSSKFVPWLQALVERTAGGPPLPSAAEVGEAGKLAQTSAAVWRPAIQPPGAPSASSPGAASESVPDRPGIYQLTENGRTRSVALLVPSGESRLDPLPLDVWDNLGVPLEGPSPSTAGGDAPAPRRLPAATAATAAALESSQQGWRWLLIAAAVVLAIESMAAIRAARRPVSTVT